MSKRTTFPYELKSKDKLIRCIELNLVFKSSAVAQKATGIDQSSILKACKGERKSAGKHPETGEKLHWEYIDIQQEEK